MNAALHDRFAWFLLHRCQRPENALQLAKQAVKLDPHSADASMTLALCFYRLGELVKGDSVIQVALNKGKSESLCLLRMAIARYHAVRKEPYNQDAQEWLKKGMALVGRAIKSMDRNDSFNEKNMREARKYEQLFLILQHRIKLGTM